MPRLTDIVVTLYLPVSCLFNFGLFIAKHACIGEGNGSPLQGSCLENPRGGEPGGLPSMGSHRVGHD